MSISFPQTRRLYSFQFLNSSFSQHSHSFNLSNVRISINPLRSFANISKRYNCILVTSIGSLLLEYKHEGLQRVKIEEEETKQLLDFSIWTLRRSEAWDKKKKSGGSPRLKIGSADLGCELLKHVPRQAYASRLETRAGTRKSRVISLSSDLKPSKILLNETKRLCLRHPLSLFLSLSFRAITI